jgi:hypothetical protein
MSDTPRTDRAALHDGTVVRIEVAAGLERELRDVQSQLERWRELAAFLAACLRDCGTIDSHAWHSRGTALESYERLKTNGTTSDL